MALQVLESTPASAASRLPHVLTLVGPQITKKNQPRPRKGGIYYDDKTHALIDSYIWQAKSQWRNRQGPLPPLTRFGYSMDLFNQRSDPDGIVTTTLDCLKSAGVITDDAARCCIRWKGEAFTDHLGPRVVVTLESLA